MGEEAENENKESIIRSIMIEQEEKTRGALNPLVVATGALGHLKEREREVLTARFGLENSKKVTLEAVGEKFGITRERVRQIESVALKRLVAKPTKELTQIIKIVSSHMVATGGLTSLDELAGYFNDDSGRLEVEANALRLIMSVNAQVVPLKKSDELRTGWAKKDFPVQIVMPVIGILEGILQTTDKTLSERELWEKLNVVDSFDEYRSQVGPEVMKGILLVASNITRAHDGKWGLSAWPTVVPKRIRDKVHVIMEQVGKPMHFSEITEALNRSYPSKKVLSRTVHNELIGDVRFVLVGRGIYALKVWGYKPGVVADVIKDVLKQAGRPMSSEEVVEEVLKHRQVKPNTVVANLQDKKLFKKVGKGVYTLRDIK